MSEVLPTCQGRVDTATEARSIIEACIKGNLPYIQRRLSTSERQLLIKHGSVFVFEETKSRMRRWTDGRLWSPSRIAGDFLVYRECERKREKPRQPAPLSSLDIKDRIRFLNTRLNHLQSDTGFDSVTFHPHFRLPMGHGGPFASQVWSGSKGTFYLKPGGLVKKTFTLPPVYCKGQIWHLVSYYYEPLLDALPNALSIENFTSNAMTVDSFETQEQLKADEIFDQFVVFQ